MKKMMAVVVTACFALGAASGHAKDWLSRPVRILVGSAPGGGTDAMARAVADRLGPLFMQPVVVENHPGVSNKSSDAHTPVMAVVTAHAIAPHLLKLSYDSNRDLVPVVFVGAVPNVLVVGNAMPAKSVADLVRLARAEPGKLDYASSGSGSTQHIGAEIKPMSQAQFADFDAAEFKRFGDLIKKNDIRLE